MSFLRPSFKNKFLRKACTIVATGFGLGYSPVAPGTVGSLLGCLIVWGFTAAELPVWGQIAACAAMTILCIPLASVAEADLGFKKDPGQVVCDEYLTFPIGMIGMLDRWQEHVWLMPMCLSTTSSPPARPSPSTGPSSTFSPNTPASSPGIQHSAFSIQH